MATAVDEWETRTWGGTEGKMTAYAGKGDYSIAFRENRHKKVVYNFHTLLELNEAILVLKKGWLSACRGK